MALLGGGGLGSAGVAVVFEQGEDVGLLHELVAGGEQDGGDSLVVGDESDALDWAEGDRCASFAVGHAHVSEGVLIGVSGGVVTLPDTADDAGVG